MIEYILGGKTIKVPEDKVDDFLSKYPDAKIKKAIGFDLLDPNFQEDTVESADAVSEETPAQEDTVSVSEDTSSELIGPKIPSSDVEELEMKSRGEIPSNSYYIDKGMKGKVDFIPGKFYIPGKEGRAKDSDFKTSEIKPWDRLSFSEKNEMKYNMKDLDIEFPYLYDSSNSDVFVSRNYTSKDLEKLNINTKDFEGFLTRKGFKEDFIEKEQGNYWNETLSDNPFNKVRNVRSDNQRKKDLEKQRVLKKYLELYIKDQDSRLNDKKRLEYIKENPDNLTEKELVDLKPSRVRYTKFNQKNIQDFLKNEYPLAAEVDNKNYKEKVDYVNKLESMSGAEALLNGGAKFVTGVGGGFKRSFSDTAATIFDVLGFDQSAGEIRAQQEEDRLSNENDIVYVSVEGKKYKDKKGVEYILDENNQIYNTTKGYNVAYTMSPFEQKQLYKKLKNSNEYGSDWSAQGVAATTGDVFGGIAFQVGGAYATGLATAGLSLRAAAYANGFKSASEYKKVLDRFIAINGKAPNTLRIPIKKQLVDNAIFQSSYGYSIGYENILSESNKAGLSPSLARELASNGAGKMAVLFGVTSFLNPRTKIQENIFGGKIRAAAEKAVKEATKLGKKGFDKSISNTIRDLSKKASKKGVEVTEEGVKEVFQENVQQAGEFNFVNESINEKVGFDLLKDTYTLRDIKNTSALSFLAAGGMANVKKPSFKSDPLSNIKTLNILGNNLTEVSTIYDEMVENSVITRNQANELIKDAEAVVSQNQKVSGNILKTDKGLPILRKLKELDDLKKNKDKLAEPFKLKEEAKIESINNDISKLIDESIEIEEARREAKKIVGEDFKGEVGDGDVILAFDNADLANQAMSEAFDKGAISKKFFEEAEMDNKTIGTELPNGQIIINREAALRFNEGTNVAFHEILHKVLRSKFNNTEDGKKYLDNFLDALSSSEKSKLEKRIKIYKDKPGYLENNPDEYLTQFFEMLRDEEVSSIEGTLKSIWNSIKRVFSDSGFKQLDFNEGQDIYEFIKDYSKNTKRSKKISDKAVELGREGLENKSTKAPKSLASLQEQLDNLDEVDFDFDMFAFEAAKTNLEKKIELAKKKEAEPRKETKVGGVETDVSDKNKKISDENKKIVDDMLSLGANKVSELDEVDRKKITKRLAENNKGLVEKLVKRATSISLAGVDDSVRIGAEEFRSGYEANLAKLINSYNYVKNKSFGAYINEFLPKRYGEILKAAKKGKIEKTSSISDERVMEIAASESTGPKQEVRKKYTSIINSNVVPSFTTKAITEKLTGIINSLKSKITDKAGNNAASTPLIKEIKSKVGKVVGDKTAIPKLIRERMGKFTKDQKTYEQFLIKNKKAILENMTTTWLMTAIPNAVEKSVGGKYTGEFDVVNIAGQEAKYEVFKPNYVPYSKWKGAKIDREGGAKRGITSGNELTRRVPANRISDQDFVDALIVKGDNKKTQSKFESLSKALAEELSFEIISRELKNPNSSITQAFKENQNALGVMIKDTIAQEFNRQAERGLVKFSVSKDVGAELAEILSIEGAKSINAKRLAKSSGLTEEAYKEFIKRVSVNTIDKLESITYEEVGTGIKFSRIGNILNVEGTDVTFNNPKNVEKAKKAFLKSLKVLAKEVDGVEKAIDIMLPTISAGWKRKNQAIIHSEDVGDGITEQRIWKDKNGKTKYVTASFIFTGRKNFFDYLKNNKINVDYIDGTREYKINGNTIKIKSTPPQTAYNFTNWDKTKWTLSKRQDYAIKQREGAFQYFETLKKQYEKGEISRTDLAMILNSFNSSIRGLIRTAAIPSYFYKVKGLDVEKDYRYEHTIPAIEILKEVAKYITQENYTKSLDNIFKNYKVAIIPIKHDKILDKYYRSTMPEDNVFYNEDKYAKNDTYVVRYDQKDYKAGLKKAGLKPIKLTKFSLSQNLKDYNSSVNESIKFAKSRNNQLPIGLRLSGSFSAEAVDKAVNTYQEAINNAVKYSYAQNPKGISVWDFDDTLARTKSNVLYTMPDGTKGKLDAAEFAARSESLADMGAEFDFSEFSKVMKGEKGPMFDKAIKRNKKFGNKNVYILTARPANSKYAIHDFLKGIGLDVRLENIVGLADGNPQAKANWMIGKVAEGYNDFYFADDHIGNVKAVREALEEFDIKGKVQQAKVKFSKSEYNTNKDPYSFVNYKTVPKEIVNSKSYRKWIKSLKGMKLFHGSTTDPNKISELGTNHSLNWFIVGGNNNQKAIEFAQDVEREFDGEPENSVLSIDASELAGRILPDADFIETNWSDTMSIAEQESLTNEIKALEDKYKTFTRVQPMIKKPKMYAEFLDIITKYNPMSGFSEEMFDKNGKLNTGTAVVIVGGLKPNQLKVESISDPTIKFSKSFLRRNKAVKDVLDNFDVKGKVQQAKVKFSMSLDKDFNEMLERNKGVSSAKEFSPVVAKRMAKNKGMFKFWMPASLDDFRGLTQYVFAGKGKQGEADQKFFQDALITPYFRGIKAIEDSRQTFKEDFKALNRAYKPVLKKLGKLIPNGDYTYDQAIRVALWKKSGYDIPGLSKKDEKNLVDFVDSQADLTEYVLLLQRISKRPKWAKPEAFWDSQTILSDLNNMTEKGGRKEYISEFIENVDIIFSEKNLLKIKALYGEAQVSALKDIIWRMKNGTNRTSGMNKNVNRFNTWVNNSIGAIMFFNRRSALLQTLSTVNFINWSDNNIIKAGAAFANQPQFWKDFAMIFNSAKLKQRRSGLKSDVNEAEIASAVKGSKNKATAALSYLLKKGFLPTQMVDSFAIASGGATFYRNRVNTYLKQGMELAAAEKQAFEDFSQISEETQQSGDPALISSDQASALGRLLLAFQNTPIQLNRSIKKAALDIKNRRRSPGQTMVQSDFSNLSKIIYYGAIQNIIFSALQNALFALIPGFGDDDDELTEEEQKEKYGKVVSTKQGRIINGISDTLLKGGFGVPGAFISTAKNMYMEYNKQEKKKFLADHTYTILAGANLAPPVGSKLRKIYSAIQTNRFEKDVIKERAWDVTIDGRFNLSPSYRVLGSFTEGATNLPLDRIVSEVNAITEALDSRNTTWQRLALAMGWKTWDVSAKNEEHDLIKTKAKAVRKKEGIEKAKKTRAGNKLTKEERSRISVLFRYLPDSEKIKVRKMSKKKKDDYFYNLIRNK